MKILLDNKEVDKLVPETLPMLIHGEEGSGASLYTIALAAKWYKQGYNIYFLCGYQMAKEEFIKIVGSSRAKFFIQNQANDFISSVKNENSSKKIIFIKNIELFDEDVFGIVANEEKVVISGNINDSKIKEKILLKKYTTRVYFSNFEGVTMPALNKYEGFLITDDFQGLTKLEHNSI